jgi:hypothetical protein
MYNETHMIDVTTSPVEVIQALPEFIKNKMFSSEEWVGSMRHEENMNGGDRTKIEPPANLKDRWDADKKFPPDEPPF